MLGADVLGSAECALAFLILTQFGHAFIDCTIDSFVIQEGRRDPVNGQPDLVLFRIFGFGVGAIIGCATGGYL